VIRWLIWFLFVVGWTIALELPVPSPERLPGAEFVMTYRVLIAKTIHVSVYVFMTMLTSWLPLAPRYRPIAVFFLMAHAGLSELGQELLRDICHRGGSVGDVALDYLGIALGLVVGWRRWTQDPASRAP
jgi:hypothetical protein